MLTKAKPNLRLFWGVTISHAVKNYYIILNVYSLHLVSKQSRSSEFLYSVNSNAHMMPFRIFDVPYMQKFCTVNILEYHPSSSNTCTTHSHVLSCVRAWFRDSAGNMDFYQISFSQSESTISHESIILADN